MSNLPPDWREPQHDEYTEEELEEAACLLIEQWESEGRLAEIVINDIALLPLIRDAWQPEIREMAEEQRISKAEDLASSIE